MKGFIGPLGDDLPSVIIIVMALTLFFSSISFTIRAYNEKIDDINYLMGAMDISRIVLAYGKVDDLGAAVESAEFVANSYGLNFDMRFKDGSSASEEKCGDKAVVFDYIIASGTELKVLSLRVCRLI